MTGRVAGDPVPRAAAPSAPRGSEDPARGGWRLVRLVALLLALLALPVYRGVTQRGQLPFVSATRLSSGWTAPPSGEFLDGYSGASWWASRGEVPPPSLSATRAQLVAWLAVSYPLLLAEVPPEGEGVPEAQGQPLRLLGSPPLRLSVVPGEGLLLRRE